MKCLRIRKLTKLAFLVSLLALLLVAHEGSSAAAESAIIVTVDGLSFIDTLLSMKMNIDIDIDPEIDYLATALAGIPNTQVFSLPGSQWNGNAETTKQAVDYLRAFLRSKYNEAKSQNKKFIVVAHSWGTVLSYLALSYESKGSDPINCDLYVLLGSPLGSANAPHLSYPAVNVLTYPTEGVISIYVIEWLQRLKFSSCFNCYPHADRVINFWVWGDIISGPLSEFAFSTPVEDVEWATQSRNEGRDPFNILEWHGYDSLNTIKHPQSQNARNTIRQLIADTLYTLQPPVVNCEPTNLSTSTNIEANFTKDMNASTLTNANIGISGSSSGEHVSSITYNNTTRSLVINPNVNFDYRETVTITFNDQVKDIHGNSLSGSRSFVFTVGEPSSNEFNIVITDPDGTNDQSYYDYIIPYNYVSSSNGTIRLFYDAQANRDASTPESVFTGIIKTNNFVDSHGSWIHDFVMWDLRQIPPGAYYIYARMSDGNYSVTQRSPGKITVTEQPFEDNIEIVGVLVEEEAGDGDLVPESGDKLGIRLKLRNKGSSELLDIEATIINYVPSTAEIREEKISIGNISPGQEKNFFDYVGDFDLTVKPVSYQGAVIFAVRFEYRRESTSWVQEIDSAYFTIHPNGTTAPVYEITAIEVISDTNGNKIPESGEDVSFKIKIKNVGTAAGIGIKGCFDPISSGYWSDNCESFPDLPPGAEGSSVGTFDIHDLPPNFSGNLLTNLRITYGEAEGFQDIENPYTLAVQPSPYIDLDPEDFNFGVKNPNLGSIDIPFVIRNYGSSNLDITNFTINSPADTQVIGTYPVSIAPGSSASFTARVTISNLNGEITPPRTIEVVSNAHSPAQNVFTITGTVASLKPPLQIGTGTKPDVYDNFIVWSNSGAVYAKDIISGALITVSSSGKYFAGPFIHEYGGRHIIAFEETGLDDIYAYVIETGELKTICTATGEQSDPKIWGRYIIWRDGRNGVDEYGGTDLYGYDLETNTEFGIAVNQRNVFDAEIHNGIAAWHTQVVSGSTTTHSIVTKPLPSGSKYTKTLGPSYPTFPGNMTFYGQKVIFDAPESQYGDDHLWIYDINTHTISKLTSYADDHVNPNAWGCKVVYEDRRSGRDIYMVDVCSPNGENPVAVSDSNLSSPAIWDQIIAYSSGGVIYAISLSDVDLSADFLCPESAAKVTEETTLSGRIYNVGTQNASGIPVKFYDGDPQNAGIQLGATQLVSVAAGSSVSVSIDWIPQTLGTKSICILAGASGDFTGLKDCCDIQVVSNDTVPPIVSNIMAEEYLGDGDGIIEDDEQVKVSFTIADPSGICHTAIDVNGVPLQTQGSYYALAGPYAEGIHSINIYASDCASNSQVEAGSFEVKPQLSIDSINACNQIAWGINIPVEVIFNLDLDPATVVVSNFVIEKTSGIQIPSTVSYQSSFRKVIISPTAFLEEGTEYRIRLISGPNGLKDESSGWFPGGQYQCNFTTDTPSNRDTDNDGIPDGWEIRNGFSPLINEAMDDADHDGYSNLREYLSGSDPQNPADVPGVLADHDSDEDVDGRDLSLFIREFGRNDCLTVPCDFDLDTDGNVDEIDLRLFLEDYGRME